MQSFLIKLLTAILFPLIDRLWDWLDSKIKASASKKKEDKTAEEARKEMDKAKTAEQIDKAADETLSGI
jgi:hypothetical protein